MPWWINQANGTVVQASLATGQAHAWLGPYSTKAEAQAALGSAGGTTASGGSRAQQISHYAGLLSSAYSAALARDYRRYMAAHPSADPTTIYTEVITRAQAFIAANKALPKTVAGFVGSTGTLTGQAGAGVASGAVSLYHGGILGFLSTLTDPHLWLRVAEVLTGVVLLAVALNALLKQSTGVNPVQVVGKVLPLRAVA